ncbi:MAG TPA: hypothetical protein ENN55_04550 [Firmicutes bacterium]|nr:hypothetical protein [Bacillota bacterium]
MRSSQEIKLHDTIIATLKNLYTNRGAVSVATINDKIPPAFDGVGVDLIIKSQFKMIFKVETESTVTEGSAIHWKQISEKAGLFYLLVPEPLKTEASAIIKQLAIPKIIVSTYRIVDNKLRFGNLP